MRVVTKLDRVARATLDLLRIVDQIGRKALGSSRSASRGPAPSPAGRLMLTVLSGIAEFERDPILQRTIEGYARPSRHFSRC